LNPKGLDVLLTFAQDVSARTSANATHWHADLYRLDTDSAEFFLRWSALSWHWSVCQCEALAMGITHYPAPSPFGCEIKQSENNLITEFHFMPKRAGECPDFPPSSLKLF